MICERLAPLQALNTFGIAARAAALVRIDCEADLRVVLADPELGPTPKFVLGGGSNIVLTGDLKATVLKVQIKGRRLLTEAEAAALQSLQAAPQHHIVEAGAGENWHDFVGWTLAQGLPGLENMALIPGTVGAAPVQNIGAYGVELQDRFHSLDAMDLTTGQLFTLNAAQCGFGYRDSVFKHAAPKPAPAPAAVTASAAANAPANHANALAEQTPKTAFPGMGLAGRAIVLRVRLALPKAWQPVLGYLDLQRKLQETGIHQPSAQQIHDWVVAIRRAKLPDPALIGNAGSFFKNPSVTPEQCADIIGRDPNVVHYPMPDGSVKLAAGWLIDACGWKGKTIGNAGVYDKQALVLVNRGGPQNPATGGEVMTLAKAIQTSVYERFGIRLEPEPVVV